MLSHCANSKCGRSFVRLAEGRLFLVESRKEGQSGDSMIAPTRHWRKTPPQVERYWLCDQCAEAWTLVQDRNGIVLLPLPPAPSRTGINTARLPEAGHPFLPIAII